jgi:hypothetical protein
MKLIFFALLLMVMVVVVHSQEPVTRQTGVLRLRVQVKIGEAPSTGALHHKRFFLIPGTLEQNRALIEAIEHQSLTSRDCYYQKLGASPELINWLKAGNCESVYCRRVEMGFVTGQKAVPEFAKAYAASQKEYGNDETALRWLTTNVPPDIRDGFYRDRQRVLQELLKQASSVQSVMTDVNGTAYFTDLGLGPYVLSNLIPTEVGQKLVMWNCQVQIKPGNLATEMPFLVSNVEKIANEGPVNCVGVEKPMPVCATD